LFIFSLQFLDYTGLTNTTWALELWYHNQTPFGGDGYYIGRFAGAAAHSSGLGLSAAVSIAILSYSSLSEKSHFIYLTTALLLLIASGHRTSLVAVMGMATVTFIYHLFNGYTPSLYMTSRFIAGTAIIGSILYIFNLGQIASTDRYSEIVSVIVSPSSFIEAGGTRWSSWRTVLAAKAQAYPLGTLTNPAYVYQDVVIDSYLILAYVQGDIIFIISYIFLLFNILLYSVRLAIHTKAGLIALFLFGTTTCFSITQNFITATSGKVTLILTIIVIWMILYRGGDDMNIHP
jgi:hypothetical protein